VRDVGGRFCACIDASAVTQLASSVGHRTDDAEMMSSPPEELRASLMLRAVAPEFVGNEHLKWMLQFSETYATRRTLVEQLLRSYYGILWNPHHPLRPTLRLDVLRGARAERAVVHIHANHWCSNERGLAPTLASKTRSGSVLFYHPDAVAVRRDTIVRQLTTAWSSSINREEFAARMRTLGEGQAQLTEKALAGMMRSYSLLVK